MTTFQTKLSKHNLSALINGIRNLNNDLALKLGHTFNINPQIWIAIQNKSPKGAPDSEYRIKNEQINMEKEDKNMYKEYNLENLLARK